MLSIIISPRLVEVLSKITKSSCDKIDSLYTSELVSPHDSVIMIINDDISGHYKQVLIV